MADIVLEDSVEPNWLITPATPLAETPLDQTWLLVLSGVVSGEFDQELNGDVVLKGNSNSDWLFQTAAFLPGGGLSLCKPGSWDEGPLNYVINHYGIQRPYPTVPDRDYTTVFSVQQWVPFVGLSIIFDANESINAGYGVRFWGLRQPPLNSTSVDPAHVNQPINNIFTGIDVDLAVRDNDAYIVKLSYNITLLGTIAFGDGNLE